LTLISGENKNFSSPYSTELNHICRDERCGNLAELAFVCYDINFFLDSPKNEMTNKEVTGL